MGGCLGKPQKGVSGEVEEEIRLGNDSTQLEIEDSALEQDFSGHGGFREVSDSGRPFPDVTKLHIDDKKPYTSAGTHYTGVGKPPLPKIGHMATNLDKGLVGENVSESMPISMPSPHKQMSAKSFKARRARSSQSSELRRSAEFWEKKDVHSLREADLVDHYHKDSELILRSLGRLHQVGCFVLYLASFVQQIHPFVTLCWCHHCADLFLIRWDMSLVDKISRLRLGLHGW